MEEYIGGPEAEVEPILARFQEALAYVLFLMYEYLDVRLMLVHDSFHDTRKYRFMEANLTQRKTSLEAKIPDIKKTLTMVEFLQERRVRSCIYLINVHDC